MSTCGSCDAKKKYDNSVSELHMQAERVTQWAIHPGMADFGGRFQELLRLIATLQRACEGHREAIKEIWHYGEFLLPEGPFSLKPKERA